MIDKYRAAIKDNPKDVPSMMFLATGLIAEKQYDEAIQILKKAMATDPECERSCKD